MNWDNAIIFAFIVFVLALRVAARTMLVPKQHKLPPKEVQELFRIDRNNNAFNKLERNEDNQISLKLKSKIKVTSDSYIFRFELPDVEMSLGLPIGNHVMFHTTIDGEEVDRPYTPISMVKDQTFVDFLIKIYRKNPKSKFPEGGQMTQYLEKMKTGDTMLMSGPHGRLTYEGCGRFSIRNKLSTIVKTKIGHIAGGTGITPIYQIL